MQKLSYSRHRFSPLIIQHSIWLYFRFTLSYRDVEDLLAERRIEVSYETVCRWVLKFGSAYARKLRTFRPRHRVSGILMKCLFRSTANDCTCGGPLIVKGRSWKIWFNPAETSGLP